MGIEESSFGQEIYLEGTLLIVFDIDGTLLPGTSTERLFVRYLEHKRILGLGNLLNFIARGLTLLPRGTVYFIKANKGYLKDFEVERMNRIGREFFDSEIVPRISNKGIARLNKHKAAGETVVLLSGMPLFLLKFYAEYLQADEYYGAVLENTDGVYTGRTIGPHPLSEGKVEIVQGIIDAKGLRWPDITAYADHGGDSFLLARAGRAIAVNPRPDLRRIAESKGWEIEAFD